MVQGFRITAQSTLLDYINHYEACDILNDYTDWLLVWEGDEYFIDATPDTDAETHLAELIKLAQAFPLNNNRLENAILTMSLSAIKNRCQDLLGTIISSPNRLLDILHEEGFEIVEKSPHDFQILIEDDDLISLIEKHSIE